MGYCSLNIQKKSISPVTKFHTPFKCLKPVRVQLGAFSAQTMTSCKQWRHPQSLDPKAIRLPCNLPCFTFLNLAYLIFVCCLFVFFSGCVSLHVVLGEERCQYLDDYGVVFVHLCCYGCATFQREVSDMQRRVQAVEGRMPVRHQENLFIYRRNASADKGFTLRVIFSTVNNLLHNKIQNDNKENN